MSNLTSGNESGECITALDRQEFVNVGILSLTLSVLSLVSGILVLALIVLTKKWKFFSERMILYLTITALLFSAFNIINRAEFYGKNSFVTGFCAFTGALIQIASWMNTFAITSITFYMFFRTVLGKNTERYEWVYILLIYVAPLLFNWIPFIHMLYGKAGLWCWIRSFDFEECQPIVLGMWFQFGMLYIPNYLLLIVLLTLYIIIVVKIIKTRRSEAKKNDPDESNLTKKMLTEVASLLAYPSIYFLLSIPPLINRIYSFFDPEPSLFLWYISGIAFPLHGFIAAITFILVNTSRKNLTWSTVRKRAMKMRTKSKKISNYPMRNNEISDSMPNERFQCAHLLDELNYTEYTDPNM